MPSYKDLFIAAFTDATEVDDARVPEAWFSHTLPVLDNYFSWNWDDEIPHEDFDEHLEAFKSESDKEKAWFRLIQKLQED